MDSNLQQAKVALQRLQKLMFEVRDGTALMTPELATQTVLVLEDAIQAIEQAGGGPGVSATSAG